ncbi:hypothetical protein [Ancrocorticia populi]|uniref:MobA-like NTP transferase domain-containing protein n=1 Tax=Ancrocorticia populi TaxID=2175228 RepID=A0A2V1KDG8_9ACTO|nr:hypothetical protein [Ancrocorticia populi]PWF27389.1 hypothetical protein DD236_03110 [Ancrocorticia populi]
MTSRYVIMANGLGMRWNCYRGIPKHLITIEGETLLARVVRQVSTRDPSAEIYISSDNPKYETPGAIRHTPESKALELDRFVLELIQDDVTFLYGDTFYTDAAIERIMAPTSEPMTFYATERSIIAVRANDAGTMKHNLDNVRSAYLSGQIAECKGWQLYWSYLGVPLGQSKFPEEKLVRIADGTGDFNYPADLREFEETRKADEE